MGFRDLKTNNLLLDLSITSDWPSLVVSDFGCCTTEGMQIPLQTDEVNRGGNPLLMAPEVRNLVSNVFLSDLFNCCPPELFYTVFHSYEVVFANTLSLVKLLIYINL